MIKILIALVAFLLLIAGYIAHPILAGGDKVRGDEGQGLVNQICDSLYGDCPYGDYDPFK